MFALQCKKVARLIVAAPGTLCYIRCNSVLNIVQPKTSLPGSGVASGGAAPSGPDIERMDVSETASISTGIADRYATAIFELAREGKKGIDTLQQDVDTLAATLSESDDLRHLLTSPIYSRDQQEAGIGAVAAKLGLSETLSNTLKLMAQKRRLFVVPQLLTTLKQRIADEKGIVTAEVTSAKALTKGQAEKLTKTLQEKVGQDVEINTTVDNTLIGGLIVKLGSRMIDTSIRSKLASLQNSMKEVG